MKKSQLNEEINKALKLMGIINEATNSKDLFRILFKELGQNIDNVVGKIEAIAGKKLAGQGISAVEGAINKGIINRKQAISAIIESLGMSADEIIKIIERDSAISTEIQAAAKAGKSEAEIIGSVSSLKDLPESITKKLLKNAGFEVVDAVNVPRLLGSMMDLYPELFRKNPLFRNFVNEKSQKALIDKAVAQFRGKNINAITDEFKLMIGKVNADLESLAAKKKINSADKTTIKSVLSKIGEALNPMHMQTLDPKKVNWVKTGGTVVVESLVLYGLYTFFNDWVETGSPLTSLGQTARTGFEDTKAGFAEYQNSYKGIQKFIVKTYGVADFTNFKFGKTNVGYDVTSNGKTIHFIYDKGTFKQQ